MIDEATNVAEAQDKILLGKPQLFVACDTEEIDATQLAAKVFDDHSVPTFLILASAGDSTQNRIIRHPGIIGVYFSPLNVDKMFERVRKFFDMVGA